MDADPASSDREAEAALAAGDSSAWTPFAARQAARFGVGQLGLALIEGERRVAADHGGGGRTLYHAASSGKHVAARVVLDLAEAGRLRLGDPVGAHVGGLPPAWRARRLDSLLHHVSGLPDYLHAGGPTGPLTTDEFMGALPGLPAPAPERASWSYSNTNYILLGLAAAAVAGRPIGAAMEARLAAAGAQGARVCTPAFVRDLNAGREPPGAHDAATLAREAIGDGDVAFTTGAALAWMADLLRSGASQLEPLAAPAPLDDGAAVPYGAGLFLEPLRDGRIAHHAGHFYGWTAMMLLNPARGAGVFALSDHAPGNTRAVRAIAVAALEAFSPGATPLGLEPLPDPDPALSARLLGQILRPTGAAPDAAAFAPSMQTAPGSRGPPNLWAGDPPLAVHLVSAHEQPGRRMLRYRLTYEQRVEHVCIGVDPQHRIDWVWPL